MRVWCIGLSDNARCQRRIVPLPHEEDGDLHRLGRADEMSGIEADKIAIRGRFQAEHETLTY